MKKSHKLVSIGVGIVLLIGAGIQAVPVDRSNPTVTMEVDAPPEVMGVLRGSCYDCHSNEVDWPWYSYIAPVSWLIAKDVREGREHVNFTTWDRYSPSERRDIIEEVYEETSEGEMPLPIYLRMHPNAELTQNDLLTLRSWGTGTNATPRAETTGKDSDEDKDDESQEHGDD